MKARPWLASYPEHVAEGLELDRAPLTEMVERAAEQWPDRRAMVFYLRKGWEPAFTYRELAEGVRRCGQTLSRLGVKPGERVALLLPNCPQFAVAFFGTLLAGAVAVPMNVLCKPGELRAVLKDSGARTVVTLDLFYQGLLKARRGTKVQRVLVASFSEVLSPFKGLLYRLTGGRGIPRLGFGDFDFWETVWSLPPYPPQVKLKAEAPATIQYSGGPPGGLRGAVLTHASLGANVAQLEAWVPDLEPGLEVVLTTLPLFHTYGLTSCLLLAVKLGATMVMVPRPRPGPLLEAVRHYRPTLFPGVPVLYRALLDHPGRDKAALEATLGAIRHCLSGAAPLPEALREAYEAATGGRLVEGYGLTEASPATHVNPFHPEQNRRGSIGLPLPETEARIVDEAGQPLPPGEVGELQVRGPQVMAGYWQRPEATDRVLDEAGWLRTHERARMDEAGYFYLAEGRLDMINVGGFKVWPQEVEVCLEGHGAVAEAAALGIPDARRGEVVKVLVVVKEGAQTSAAELEAHCRERLASFKVPRVVEFRREPLPRNEEGELNRRELQARGSRGADQD